MKLIFQGLPPGMIPLTPSLANFSITDRTQLEKKNKIIRRQYPMAAGYAFTDYKSQGQTIEYVIIDIGKPPTGTLTILQLRGTFTKQRKGHTIRLLTLRDFDINLFQNYPYEALRTEMKRLEDLIETTRKDWVRRHNNIPASRQTQKK